MRIVIATGDVGDATQDFYPFAASWHERRFFNHVILHGNELGIDDAIAGIVFGSQLFGDLVTGFEFGKPCVDRRADDVFVAAAIKGNGPEGFTFQVLEHPVLGMRLAVFALVLLASAGLRRCFRKPFIAVKTESTDAFSSRSTPFGVEFFAMRAAKQSPFSGTESIYRMGVNG